jgi:hypothetical protein
MKTLVFVSLLILSLHCLHALAQEQQVVVPYTLADRDRAILTEAKISALEAKMDVKFEAVNARMEALETRMYVKFDSIQKQIDQLSMLFYWGFGILITLFIFMLGYMIWDRRTALQPALDKATDADAKSTNLILALREYSKKHADLAEILRTHGIL